MRNRWVLVADLAAIALSVLGAFVLRLDWFFNRQPEYTAAFWFLLGSSLLVKPPVFFVFGLYGRYWRYATARDLLVIILAVSTASVAGASSSSANSSPRRTWSPSCTATVTRVPSCAIDRFSRPPSMSILPRATAA